MTTVGYGSHNYSTSSELLYVCFLEVLATLSQAFFITMINAAGLID